MMSELKVRVIVLFLAAGFLLPVAGMALDVGDVEKGDASYMADSLDGNTTASGEAYDKDAMTAAHRTLPFGSRVKVTYLNTGKSVELRINDRGPRTKGRIIDVSGAAAKALGMVKEGHGPVTVEVLAK